MTTRVSLGPEYFPNPSSGRPISSGDLYVGSPDTDPEVVGNQIQVSVLQEDGTVTPVSQPVSTGAGGVPLYNGSPVTLLVDESNYSLTLLNSSGAQVYHVPSRVTTTGNPLYISDYNGDLAAAVADIGSDEKTLIINEVVTIASGTTVTIPATMELSFISGGQIQGVAGGGVETLVINGAITANEKQQIFGSDLTVTVTSKKSMVHWWPSLAAAVASIGAADTTLVIDSTQTLTAGLSIPENIALEFLRDGYITGAFTLTMVNANQINSGEWQIFDSTTTATFTEFSQFPVEWYGDVDTDIGAAINAALTANTALGAYLKLPSGKPTCTTTINIDLANSSAVVVLQGASSPTGASPLSAGTFIDGSGMATSVITAGLTQNRFNLYLKDFAIKGGTGKCFQLGSDATAYSVVHGEYSNLVAVNGTHGFDIQRHFGNYWINKLYAIGSTTRGFLLKNINTCLFGAITARTGTGSYGVEIDGALGTNFGTMYIESNDGGELRASGDMRSCVINNIYAENNNVGAAADYGIHIGDVTVSADSVRGLEINGMFLSPPSTAYAVAHVAVEKADHLVLGTNAGNTLNNPLFTLLDNHPRQIVFRNWDIISSGASPSMDFSAGASTNSITFENCDVDYGILTLPTHMTINVHSGPMQRQNLTTDASTVTPYGFTTINSASNKVDCTLPDGVSDGQFKLVTMNNATNASDMTVTHHDLGDGGSYTFDAVDEAVLLQWTYNEWVEVGTFGGIGAYTP